MDKIRLERLLKRFIQMNLKQSDEYGLSRRFQDQFERCEDTRPFENALLLIDSTMNTAKREELSSIVYETLKARRADFSRLFFGVWDGNEVKIEKPCRISGILHQMPDVTPSENKSAGFTKLFRGSSRWVRSSEIVFLIISPESLKSMEAIGYTGADKTILITYGETDFHRTELNNRHFSVLTLTM